MDRNTQALMTVGTPRNQLLSALPATHWQPLQPLLRWAELACGSTLFEAGAAPAHVYFPETAIVSLTSTMQDGASAEIAVVGAEGLVGVSAFLSDGVSLCSAVVQRSGRALKMPAQALRDAISQGGPLLQGLMRYTQALLAQMAQGSACCRHHALEQRLCRWLLLHHDRAASDELDITHERIAQLLGARRAGVTVNALKLQEAGLIRYRRGRLSILDRAGIEQRCCECYDAVRRVCEGLSGAAAQARRRVGHEAALPQPACA